VDGQPQQPGGERIVAMTGAGWYPPEADNQGRWSDSPSELLVYSPTDQRVQLQLMVSTLYDGANGLGDQGTMHVAVGDQVPRREEIRTGQPLNAEVHLRAGWNSVKLALEARNFQASQLFPGSGDQRWLSFKIEQIDIRTK
jgi:hypothetical protein